MTPRADLTVRSPNGDIALVVEVKAKVQATDQWAAALRRNLIAHGMTPDSAYFLLALPVYFFLWKPHGSVDAVNADYKIPASDVVQPYLDDLHLEDLSSSSLELLLEFRCTGTHCNCEQCDRKDSNHRFDSRHFFTISRLAT